MPDASTLLESRIILKSTMISSLSHQYEKVNRKNITIQINVLFNSSFQLIINDFVTFYGKFKKKHKQVNIR
jgi:hypothetical protein